MMILAFSTLLFLLSIGCRGMNGTNASWYFPWLLYTQIAVFLYLQNQQPKTNLLASKSRQISVCAGIPFPWSSNSTELS